MSESKRKNQINPKGNADGPPLPSKDEIHLKQNNKIANSIQKSAPNSAHTRSQSVPNEDHTLKPAALKPQSSMFAIQEETEGKPKEENNNKENKEEMKDNPPPVPDSSMKFKKMTSNVMVCVRVRPPTLSELAKKDGKSVCVQVLSAEKQIKITNPSDASKEKICTFDNVIPLINCVGIWSRRWAKELVRKDGIAVDRELFTRL
jgi:hypothetical protein